MQRDIIHIDQDKCNGCGLCITACHEGALALVNGKARLISESYCDGLGACLPECPTEAISIIKKEADAFTAPAPGSPADLEARQKQSKPHKPFQQREGGPGRFVCPGSQVRSINRSRPEVKAEQPVPSAETESELMQWPVQIKLVPVFAPFFDQASLLIAADCAAYARASFHQDFMKNKTTLIGCPKLDTGDYTDKLSEIIRQNDIRRVTVVRMQVPCCGGLEQAVKQALLNSGKMLPWQVVTLATDGTVIDD